jgi:two-component system LytT family response regulator
VLIADDEPAGRRTVQLLLAGDPEIQVVGQCCTADETIDAVLRHRPDLLFLDVQMPGGTGFDALAQIPPAAMPLIVFVTAFDEYAIQAFAVDASDYLLKPFSDSRFRAALVRAKDRLRWRTAAEAERVATLLGRLGADGSTRLTPQATQGSPAQMTIRTSDGILLLALEQVEWIEARGDYVRIHSCDRVELLREPIGRVAERLDPARFVRIHRSAIVNLDRVREIKRSRAGDCTVVLHSGVRCKLSRSGRERLGRILGQAV